MGVMFRGLWGCLGLVGACVYRFWGFGAGAKARNDDKQVNGTSQEKLSRHGNKRNDTKRHGTGRNGISHNSNKYDDGLGVAVASEIVGNTDTGEKRHRRPLVLFWVWVDLGGGANTCNDRKQMTRYGKNCHGTGRNGTSPDGATRHRKKRNGTTRQTARKDLTTTTHTSRVPTKSSPDHDHTTRRPDHDQTYDLHVCVCI